MSYFLMYFLISQINIYHWLSWALSNFNYISIIIYIVKSFQTCLTLCDPMNYSPGSSVYGIHQARTLEQAAIQFSSVAQLCLTLCDPMNPLGL